MASTTGDDGDLLGMLDGQSLRATRVIVDIGMHLELEIPADNRLGTGGAAFHPGETWTPALGLEFITNLDQRWPSFRFTRKFWEFYLSYICRGKELHFEFEVVKHAPGD